MMTGVGQRPLPRLVSVFGPGVVYIGRAGRGYSGLFGNPVRLGRPCPVCRRLHQGRGSTSVVSRPGHPHLVRQRLNATALILTHNHPSGDPEPSPEDVQVTRQIVEAGRLLGIEVLDHLVIGYNRFVSLKERGLGW